MVLTVEQHHNDRKTVKMIESEPHAFSEEQRRFDLTSNITGLTGIMFTLFIISSSRTWHHSRY